MDRRVFMVPDWLAGEMIEALDRVVRVNERVTRIRETGYDEADLPFEATADVARVWRMLRGYAAERAVAGGLIVAVPVPGHPDDQSVHVSGHPEEALPVR